VPPFSRAPVAHHAKAWLRRLLHVDFELVLRRPIETARLIGSWLDSATVAVPSEVMPFRIYPSSESRAKSVLLLD
jgi:hypothetical protein